MAAKRIAIAGVTGAVGQEILTTMTKRNFPFNQVDPGSCCLW